MKTFSQRKPVFNPLSSLPGNGWAGMFAGVSNGSLFCMGGANFPDKKPWEGGAKKWYDDIYMLENGREWVKLKEKLPRPLAYGLSVSYHDEIIIIGGSDDALHYASVTGFYWNGGALRTREYPDLPVGLANMTGAVLGDLIIVAGGNQSPSAMGEHTCYGLDLKNSGQGWITLPAWPGRERILAVCGVWNDRFYLFGGETTLVRADPESERYILEDAYCFILRKTNGLWTGTWEKLPDMPKGISAGASPLPILEDIGFVFWGGVDAVAALYKQPSSHPGFSNDVLSYHPEKRSWTFTQKLTDARPRVTLPVVNWNGKWIYISGETAPGVRTPSVYAMQ